MRWKQLLHKRSPKEDMSFVDHLEELRWHLVRSVAAVVTLAIIIFMYRNAVFDYFILAPLRNDFWSYQVMCALGEWLGATEYLCVKEGIQMKLQSTEIAGIFNTTIKFSLIGGLIGAFPFIVWEVWKFVKPALKEKEARMGVKAIFFVSLFFFMGALFGYFVIAPFSINFLFSFNLGELEVIEVKPTLNDYIENLTTTILGVAIAFELPVVIYALAKLAIVNATQLRKFRKYTIVIILFLSAVITPSPDWISQMIVALPLLFLYELSILVTLRVNPNKAKPIWE